MVKAIFGPWIFRNTYDKDILKRLERAEDIQYKKLSMITNKMVMEFYRVVGARSPIVANRLIEYLRISSSFVYIQSITLDLYLPFR